MTGNKKQGQVFMMDYILGTLMFFALAILGVVLIMQIIPNTQYEQLYEDTNFISQMLTGTGYPFNWTNETVIMPGIADNHRLNLTKLDYLDNMSYEDVQSLLQTPNDFLFYFENITTILNISNCTHGYTITTDPSTCEPDMLGEQYDNLVKSTRLLAHNGSIVRFVLYTWN